jgi:hypothetical protein
LKGEKVNAERIEQAMENAIVDMVRKGEPFTINYQNKIDISEELKKAYKNIDYSKVYAQITAKLEEELAEKIVNKIVTEMGTDIKRLMENSSIREDFRFLMRKGVEAIMEKVKE